MSLSCVFQKCVNLMANSKPATENSMSNKKCFIFLLFVTSCDSQQYEAVVMALYDETWFALVVYRY